MRKKSNVRRKTYKKKYQKSRKNRYQKKTKRRYQKKSKRRSKRLRGGAAAGGEAGGESPSGEIKFRSFIETLDPNNLVELEAIRAEREAKEKVDAYNEAYAKTSRGSMEKENTLEFLIKELKKDYKKPLAPDKDTELEIKLFSKIMYNYFIILRKRKNS